MEGVKVEKGTCPSSLKKPNRYCRAAATTTKAEIMFQAKNDDLKGHILDCANSNQADQHAVMMKELVEYI
jgi:hypothetical protein